MKKIIRYSIPFYVAKRKIFEYFRFDSRLASLCLSVFYLLKVCVLKKLNKKGEALQTAGSLYRHTIIKSMRRYAIRILHKEIRALGNERIGKIFLEQKLFDDNELAVEKLRQSINEANKQAFDKRLIILSFPQNEEKGVMLIKFTGYFRLFAKIFDLNRLCKDYVIIFEPSSSGYFDDDILFLMAYRHKFIIQTGEPTDFNFIESLKSNLIPIDISANWWVDQTIFRPKRNCKKDFDLIIVSIWADVKRHYSLFEALKKTKRKLRIALVGKPWQRSKDDILAIAEYYGVEKQLTIFERVTQQELNVLYNRSKAYMLLSKKEGFNKSIIEALFANVPVFLIDGFNFGYKYDYINKKTGGFVNRDRIDEFLEGLNNQILLSSFSPNEWVSKNMTNDIAIKKIKNTLMRIEKKEKIKINKDMFLKVNNPDLDYQEENIWKKLKPIYKNLGNYMVK